LSELLNSDDVLGFVHMFYITDHSKVMVFYIYY